MRKNHMRASAFLIVLLFFGSVFLCACPGQEGSEPSKEPSKTVQKPVASQGSDSPQNPASNAAIPRPATKSQRIVSLVPSLTEIAYALDLGSSIVGVSDFDTFPPEVKDKERLGGLLNPNLEKLVLLKPDLVLLHASSKSVADKAGALKIPTLSVKADSLAEIYTSIDQLATKTNRKKKGQKLVETLQKSVGAYRAAADKPKVKVLLVVGRNPGGLEGITSVGPGSFLHELLELTGGENVAASSGKTWPQVSKEVLLADPPDAIIELSPGAPEDPKALEPWNKLPSIPAVKNKQLYRLTGTHLLVPGPRLVKTAEDLHKTLEKVRAAK